MTRYGSAYREHVQSEIRNLKSSGFTLLEVMLALALVTLVLALVATAVHLHLRVVDSSRTEVEEAQLARALLRRIGNDLRSAVQQPQIDVSKLMPDSRVTAAVAETIEAATKAGLLEDGALDAITGEGDAWDELDEDEDEDTTDYTTDLAASASLPPVPGLYGNMYEMQVDTSRVPRIDEYAGLVAGDSMATSYPSDVKTVTYFVAGNLYGGTGRALTSGTGLVRREMDRATASYAAEMGQLSDYWQDIRPIAPEVVAIQFAYFDGTEVVQEWDSQQRGGLPMAVEVTLWIQPKHRRNDSAASDLATAEIDRQDLLVYRLLVHLPIAQPTTLDTASDAGSEETDETDDSDTGTGSGLGGGLPR